MIELLTVDYQRDDHGSKWLCRIAITQDDERIELNVNAKPEIDRYDLLDHYSAQEDELWEIAQTEGKDIFDTHGSAELLRAMAQVVEDELNDIREEVTPQLDELDEKHILLRITGRLNGV